MRSCSRRIVSHSLRVAAIGRRAALQPREHRLLPLPVDRPAVVGVDERAERQLVALVDVGHAGHGQLQGERAQRDPVARRAPPSPTNGSKSARNGAVLVEPAAEARSRPAPSRRSAPPSWCCAWPRAAPSPCSPRSARARSATRRPASGTGSSARGRRGRRRSAAARSARASGARAAAHCSGIVDQRRDPRAHVGRALGVVGVGGQHRQREALARARRGRRGSRSTAIPNRPGSPPTSHSASRRP